MINLWKNRNWSPMLLKELNKPFNSKEHIFEIKFDGIRAIIFANKKEIIIKSRNKTDLTNLFPELQSIKKIVNKNVIFDGEIIYFDKNKESFNKLQKRIHLKNRKKILNEAKNNPVTFIAFDILYENKNLTNLPLIKRKIILNEYNDNDNFIKIKYIDEYGINVFKSTKQFKLEGIVAKHKNGKYYINQRTDEYIKIKNIKSDKFIIGGYEIKKNNILSLALGEFKNNSFLHVGNASITKKK